MIFPNFIDEPFVDAKGKLTDTWRYILMQTFQTLQGNLSPEGIKAPQQTNTNIGLIGTDKAEGAIIYNSDPTKKYLMVNLPSSTSPTGYLFQHLLTSASLGATYPIIYDPETGSISFAPGTSGQYFRGDLTWETLDTLAVPENTNLYYTDTRARSSISSSATGLTYTPSTGVLSLTTGYVVPTTIEESNWNTAYTESVSSWPTPLTFTSHAVTITTGYYFPTTTDQTTWNGMIPLTQKGVANGVATLDAGGLVPTSQIPPTYINNVYVVASQAAMLALSANIGDVAVRTDVNETFILRLLPPSVLANWVQLLAPLPPVTSVNGLTGNVSLGALSPLSWDAVNTRYEIQQANTSQGGYLSNTDWNTFNSKEPTVTKGNLTEVTSSVLTITGGTGAVIGSGTSLQVKQSSSTVNGYLSSTDWATFNGKEPAISTGTSLQYWRGDKTWQTLDTKAVPENTNLYYTDSRARAAISSSATGLTYTSSTGVFSLTTGYVIPTTTEETNWNTAYSNRIATFTTTGSSGSATFTSNTLNIPTYTLSGLGGQPLSTSLTSLAGLTYASNAFVKMTAAGTFGLDTNTYITSLSGAVLVSQATPQTIGDTTNRLAKLWATDITVSNAIAGSVTGNSGSATYSSASTITDDTTTNATMYVAWYTTNTGNLATKVTSSKLTWNPSTGTLSATTFNGAFSGTVTNAVNIGITDDTTTAAIMYPLWVTANTGNLPAKVSSTKLSFNPSTGILTSTGFSGPLAGNVTGNVTGNVSGSSGTCTGNAGSSTYTSATTITNDTTNVSSVYPTWVTANTGNLPSYVSSTKLSFVPNTGILTSTGFSGPLTGNVTGNCSGSSGTCTGNAGSATYASALTIANDAVTAASVYPTWVTANTGNIAQYTTSAKLSFVPSTGILTATGFSGPLTGNVTGNASGSSGTCTGNAGSSTYSSASTIVDDSSNATMYPTWVTANTGNLPLKTTSSKLTWNPSTGTLSATTFSGAFTGTLSNLSLPTTTSSVGQILWNSVVNIHTYGTRNFFAGGAGNFTLTGHDLVGIGTQALALASSESYSTAVGHYSLSKATGGDNVAFGFQALQNVTTGVYNTGIGTDAGLNITTGNRNIYSGRLAGINHVSSESSNIIIANDGTTGDNNTIRIGTHGTSAGQQSSAYIAGIYSTAPTSTTQQVVVISNGYQLGAGSGLAFNPTTSTLTTTTFSGALSGNVTGNVTGNVSGSSGTCTGNAGSATYASAITIVNDGTTATAVYPTWVSANTGNIAAHTTSARLSFVPSTGILTATGFSGPLTGNVTGNASGSSGSCTGNAASATQVYVTAKSDAVVYYMPFVANRTSGNADLDVSNGSPSIVAGGANVGNFAAQGIIFAPGLSISGTTDSSSTTTGSIVTTGGAAVAKTLYVGTGIYLPTTSGTASQLDYYEEYTLTTNFTGPCTLSSVVVKCVRIGKQVTIYIPPASNTATVATFFSSTVAIKSTFRPSSSVNSLQSSCIDNGGRKIASVVLDTAGSIYVYILNAGVFQSFTGAGGAGWDYPLYINYITAF